MHCNHCGKEEETITIAGKTYCANCSTVLAEKKVPESNLPKHKMPKLETTDNEIRTEQPAPQAKDGTPDIKELSREAKIPEVDKDDLEGSAILLDILSGTAKGLTDQKTIAENKKLEEASEKVLDLLEENQTKPAEEKPEKPAERVVPRTKEKTSGVMTDIIPKNISRRADYINKKHSHIVKEVENEVKNIGRIVTSESGYTKEYDVMILSVALTAVAMAILAIFLTFR